MKETKIELVEGMGDVANMNIESLPEEKTDELEQLELKEEHYLKVDSVAKQQFDYNRNIALANDFPELQVKTNNDPIALAPGEGIYGFYNDDVM